jgi:hypothetical protein
MRCEAAGLDPRAQPFQYVSLNSKLVLYATKACADQLIASRHLSVSLISRGYDRETGLYSAQARATFPDGQAVEDLGAVWIPEGEVGDKLANAVLKCITKAKRRTVLSACGLGMLDETEVDSIPGAIRITEENSRVIERPTPAPIVHAPNHEPKSQVINEPISDLREFLESEIKSANSYWFKTLSLEGKAVTYRPLVEHPNQVGHALVTDWLDDGTVQPEQVLKSDGSARNNAKVGALVKVRFSEDPEAVKRHVRSYLRRKLEEAAADADVRLVDPDSDLSQAATDDDTQEAS